MSVGGNERRDSRSGTALSIRSEPPVHRVHLDAPSSVARVVAEVVPGLARLEISPGQRAVDRFRDLLTQKRVPHLRRSGEREALLARAPGRGVKSAVGSRKDSVLSQYADCLPVALPMGSSAAYRRFRHDAWNRGVLLRKTR
jgi:hypothetical protein